MTALSLVNTFQLEASVSPSSDLVPGFLVEETEGHAHRQVLAISVITQRTTLSSVKETSGNAWGTPILPSVLWVIDTAA